VSGEISEGAAGPVESRQQAGEPQGRLAGKYSIRINDQFRIVFNFDRGDAGNVVISDDQ
jgi:plasmid maintenance system killer protein